MTLRSLAFSSIRGSLKSYGAFLASSAFSVMVFYLYAAFLAHPDLAGDLAMKTGKFRQGMVFCQYIIAIFSFLFVLYSNSAFLKSRKQELGLLALFGMTRGQLCRFLVYESIVIAAAAIGIGIGLGILTSKPFFMALAVLLHIRDPIAAAVPLQAVWMTAGGFFCLFLLLAWWTARHVSRMEIADLLKAARSAERQPVYSPWLAILAVVCLASGYGMALELSAANFNLMAPLVLLTVILGTYLVFTQFSTLLLRWIQNCPAIYYRRTILIVFAQLGHKLLNSARTLFLVAILSAVTLTASGTIYMLGLAVKLNGIQTQYEDPESVISLAMFVGIFISVLFFIASGSMIYFKLFTELHDEQAQFKALNRIGLTPGELRSIVVMQAGVLFFAPCLVGIVHALVALKALNNLIMVSNWIYSFVVIGIYLGMQTIYFLVACRGYMTSIPLIKEKQR